MRYSNNDPEYSSHYSAQGSSWQPYDYQWHTYRQLELISDATPNPDSHSFAFGLGFLWRGLLNLLAKELVDEQRVEYLERCWVLDDVNQEQPPTTTIQRLWTLME